MNRRGFLTTCATLSIGAIAGCSSGGDTSTDNTTTTRITSDVETTISETSTEKTETTTEVGEPEFKLISFDAPKQVEIGKEFTIKAEIKNVGNAAGKFHSVISGKTVDSDWQKAGDIETEEIAPGETATWTSKTVTFSYQMQTTFRIEQLDKQFTIRSVSRKLAFGETFTSPEGVAVTVQKLELKTYYEYEDYDGNTAEKRAGDGKQWAFVYLKAKNETGESQFVPLTTDVNLVAGNTQYDEAYINKEANKYDGGEVESGIVRKGWIAYEIPDDLSKADVRVAWSGEDINGKWSVRWSKNVE